MELIKVDFHNDSINVVEENQTVVIRDICLALGVDSKSQITKIQSDPTYESQLIKVQTNGGLQEVFCIPLNKLNGWLFSINPNKVRPEVKEKLIAYKKECFDVLHKHFMPTQLPTITPRQLDMLTPYAIKRDLSTARLRLTLAKKHNEKVIAEFTRLAKQRVDRFKEQEQLLKAHQDKMCVLQDKFYDTEDELERVQHELENKTKELEQVQSELAMRTEETRQLNYRILDHEDTIEKMDKANPSYYRNIFNEDGEEPDKFYEPLLHNGFLDFMYKSSAIKDHIHRLMLTYPHIKEELEDKHNSLTIYLNSMRAFYSKLQGVNKITLEPFGQLEQR